MNEVEGEEIAIFSNDRMLGRLLDYLFASQGLSSRLDNYPDGAMDFLGGQGFAPRIAILDIPRPMANKEKPCQMAHDMGWLEETSRIILSGHQVDCRECSFYLQNKCEHLQKPFLTAELVGKVKDFLS